MDLWEKIFLNSAGVINIKVNATFNSWAKAASAPTTGTAVDWLFQDRGHLTPSGSSFNFL